MHHQIVPNDLVEKIISYLPLKFAVQCKVISKNLNIWISDPEFRKTLSQNQKICTLINSSRSRLFESLHKISINSSSITASHFETTLPVNLNVLAISEGLILLDFCELMKYCVFNPITGAHQLIPYPDPEQCYWEAIAPAFAVDYPTSDRYMLVTVKLTEEGYGFKVFSSIGCGVWHEFHLGEENQFLYVVQVNPDSIHWLIRTYVGGVILGFHTKKIENSIVISSYDHTSNDWSVSYNVTTNFISGLDYYSYSFPVWIDREQLFFLAECPPRHDHDSGRKRYQITPALEDDYCFGYYPCELYTFAPTLASVQSILSCSVYGKHVSSIIETLDELKRFITDNNSYS
ncbi:uncharacterized protein [Solanum lycopersicum]|uniref:uncharacterized protein n=1 Tax=Solanum lycopersicum TaxID=4081 RepID=UPI0002768769|nr:uncharacterized protein LOC104646509 [Solanum lycopersicum]